MKKSTDYSERNAVTGSFFAAFFAGIRPPMIVNIILSPIKNKALVKGKDALTLSVSVTA